MESHSDSLGMPLDNHAHLVFPVASERLVNCELLNHSELQHRSNPEIKN